MEINQRTYYELWVSARVSDRTWKPWQITMYNSAIRPGFRLLVLHRISSCRFWNFVNITKTHLTYNKVVLNQRLIRSPRWRSYAFFAKAFSQRFGLIARTKTCRPETRPEERSQKLDGIFVQGDKFNQVFVCMLRIRIYNLVRHGI